MKNKKFNWKTEVSNAGKLWAEITLEIYKSSKEKIPEVFSGSKEKAKEYYPEMIEKLSKFYECSEDDFLDEMVQAANIRWNELMLEEKTNKKLLN